MTTKVFVKTVFFHCGPKVSAKDAYDIQLYMQNNKINFMPMLYNNIADEHSFIANLSINYTNFLLANDVQISYPMTEPMITCVTLDGQSVLKIGKDNILAFLATIESGAPTTQLTFQ